MCRILSNFVWLSQAVGLGILVSEALVVFGDQGIAVEQLGRFQERDRPGPALLGELGPVQDEHGGFDEHRGRGERVGEDAHEGLEGLLAQ